MAVIDTLLTFGMGWLLGKGGPFGGKKTSPAPGGGGGKGSATSPSNVPWPSQDLQERAAVEQLRHDGLQTQLDTDAQLAVNQAKAAGDKEGLAVIAQKKREKQKALDDMQRDIDAAKRASNPSLIDKVKEYFAGTNPAIAGDDDDDVLGGFPVLDHPHPRPRRKKG